MPNRSNSKSGFRCGPHGMALLFVVLLATHVESISAQPEPLMTCTLERPVVGMNESVSVSAWVSAQNLAGRSVRWLAPSGGTLQGDGLQSTWDFDGVAPSAYQATAVLSQDGAELGRCSAVVIVDQRIEQKGAPLLTGRALLVKGEFEADDYGYYSYLIILSQPESDRRKQTLRIIETFLRKAPQVLELESYGPRSGLNIAYLPVTEAADESFNRHLSERDYAAAAEWILLHYDHARAHVLMQRISKHNTQGGPFIVSYVDALSRAGVSDETRLHLQDFTHVPVNLITRLVEGYFNRAGQTDWTAAGVEAFAENMVILFSVVAEGAEISRAAIDDWLSWGVEVKKKLDQV